MQPPNTNSYNEFPPLPIGGRPTVPSWTNSNVYQANANPAITNNYFFDRVRSPKRSHHHSPTKMSRRGIDDSPTKAPPHQLMNIPNFTDQDNFTNTYVVFKGNVSNLSRENAIELLCGVFPSTVHNVFPITGFRMLSTARETTAFVSFHKQLQATRDDLIASNKALFLLCKIKCREYRPNSKRCL